MTLTVDNETLKEEIKDEIMSSELYDLQKKYEKIVGDGTDYEGCVDAETFIDNAKSIAVQNFLLSRSDESLELFQETGIVENIMTENERSALIADAEFLCEDSINKLERL